MPLYSEREDYEKATGTFKNVSGDGTVSADTDLVVIEVPHVGFVTRLEITGANLEHYDLVFRDQDGSNSTVKRSYATSDLRIGDFRDPVADEFGAQREIAVINRTQLADANYGVNIDVHHLEEEAHNP